MNTCRGMGEVLVKLTYTFKALTNLKCMQILKLITV